MALVPALQIDRADGELVLAVLDDFQPTAAEERPGSLTVFFASDQMRCLARQALAATMPHAVVFDRDVDDEDWARRSQADLSPIVVGRLTIWPQTSKGEEAFPARTLATGASSASVVIRPSMGFGTGHHASTRLCLSALQTIDLSQSVVLDVGTGSGILALAARRLGALAATGIDTDADAVQSARDNASLNPDLDGVRFDVADLNDTALPVADLVTANLTGALLRRSAVALCGAVKPGGHLVLSGVLDSERDEVADAYAGLELVSERREDEWVSLHLRKPPAPVAAP